MSKHIYSLTLLAFAFAFATFAGCGSSGNSGSSSGGQNMDELAAMLDKPGPASTPPVEAATAADSSPIDESRSEAARGDEQSSTSQTPAAEAPASDNRAVAGRAPIGEGGYFVAIGGARRQILNRVEDLAWTQAVQHFQATEGRLPRDHEEFMSKIVEPLGIDLGFKEEDQEFLYDPNEGRWGTVYVVTKDAAPAQ